MAKPKTMEEFIVAITDELPTEDVAVLCARLFSEVIEVRRQTVYEFLKALNENDREEFIAQAENWEREQAD